MQIANGSSLYIVNCVTNIGPSRNKANFVKGPELRFSYVKINWQIKTL